MGRTFVFPDYAEGRIVERSDPTMIVGTQAFELSVAITPTERIYGMLASHDRCGDGSQQFRLEIYPSMKVSLMCDGTGARGGRADGDGNGYRSELCTGALPLHKTSWLRVTRHVQAAIPRHCFQLFSRNLMIIVMRMI